MELEEFQGTFENDEILEIKFIVKKLYNLFINFYTSLVLLFNYFLTMIFF
jgi:hypothetical protein